MHQLILGIGNTIMWVIEHLWKGVHTYMLKYFLCCPMVHSKPVLYQANATTSSHSTKEL